MKAFYQGVPYGLLLFFLIIPLPAFGKATSNFSSAYFEPFAGYEDGDYEFDSSLFAGNKKISHTVGANWGIRAGWVHFFAFFGLEYHLSSLGGSFTTGGSADLDTTNMGVFGGYQFRNRIRLSYTYLFNIKLTDTGNAAGIKPTGSGYKFVVGFRLLRWLTINGEYIVRNTTGSESSITINAKTATYGVSVGLPFKF